MDWDDVRYFLALARVGAVRSAGSALGVSHSTVARRVEALEVRLAVRLFDRNRDGYVLTRAGQQMLPGAERVEREMAALERGLVGQDERLAGPVRLTCCDEFVSAMILKELTVLCGAYPEVELAITADSRPFDLSKREADIALRILGADQTPPEHLIGRKVVPVMIANYIGTEHIHRLDPELEQSRPRWVCPDTRKFMEVLVSQSSYPDVPLWGSFSSLELLMQAAREGLGIAMLPCYVADRDPVLRRLAQPDVRHLADLWVLCHPDLRDNARIAATRDSVTQALNQHEGLFAGEEPVAPTKARR